MIVAGVMSGTSADGIDVALVRILGRGPALRMKLLGHHHTAYPPPVRKFLLRAMDARSISVADLARLDFLLGELYAATIKRAVTRHGIARYDLIGCHGQTLYHQGEPRPFLGTPIACTWQTGEASIIAARCGVPVVSDFRPADMAARGKGAPLVPYLDWALLRHRTRGRILQNLGGIGNLTSIPAGARPEQLIAFDTGPANMVIDACMQKLFAKPFDDRGRVAATGRAHDDVVQRILRQRFFHRPPPRTAGREEFGRAFVASFLRMMPRIPPEDVIATATALTAASISTAVEKFVLPRDPRARDFIVSGGGSRNAALMRMLRDSLTSLGLKIQSSDTLGVPSQAKEAMAFALLAYETFHRRPANVPSATGAARPAVLGKISYA